MWIKPKYEKKLEVKRDNEVDLLERAFGIIPNYILGALMATGANINFLKDYKRDVFTKYEQLKDVKCKVDCVIFTGYAGCGHYAPAIALAKEYESRGLNVMLIDPLFMLSGTLAVFNCNMWKFVARHAQQAWSLTRKIAATSNGADFIFGFAKKLTNKKLMKFLREKRLDVILSTYTYTDAIMSRFLPYARFVGVVIPDTSPIGFTNEVYHNTKDIHYFYTSQKAKNFSHKIYPYTAKCKYEYVVGMTPTFAQKSVETNNNQKTLLFIPGSGMGIGKGIKYLKDICENYKYPIVVVCGDNQKWLKYATKLAKNYYNNLIPLGYVEPTILKELMHRSNIIVGKPGGSLSVEMASLIGCKIFFEPILGQEVENAKYFEKLGCATYAKTIDELLYYITQKKPITKSLYSGFVSNSTTRIVNISLMNK